MLRLSSSSSSATLFQAQRPIAKQGNTETIKNKKTNKQTDKQIRNTKQLERLAAPSIAYYRDNGN
jgi:hypothetical protein